MTDKRSDNQLEQAALHALGALDGTERLEFERLIEDEGTDAQHARAELASFVEVAARLGLALSPTIPPPRLKPRLLEKIQRTAQDPSPTEPDFTFIRSTEGAWIEPMPGMKVKVLHVDPITHRTTSIVKFAPGYRFHPHRHAETEELFVLEGGCVCQGQVLLPGDYHRSDAGSVHGETTTDDGCTLLIIFSPRNEALGSVAARVSSTTVSLLMRLSAIVTRLATRLTRPR
jgi:quercetin dioxygenase-like cupin family protein